MSSYTLFIKDFPSRCADLLETYYEPAKNKNREVTLMISIASSGFVIPLERLKDSRDRDTSRVVTNNYNNIRNKPFIKSEFYEQEANSSWRIGELIKPNGSYSFDDWKGLDELRLLGYQYQVDEVFKILRNALAHGNIFFDGKNHIEKIFFISKGRGSNYNVIVVSPSDFHLFLKKWFAYLSNFEFREIVDDSFWFNP